MPLTPNGEGLFSARVTLGEGPASRTLDMIVDTGAAISGVPAGVANALIAAKQAVELSKRLVTLANGARENERTIGIITVTVGHHVAHQAVAAVTNGTPFLGLPVLRQIGRFTIDAAYEQLILDESTQCETPSEATLKEAHEPQAQVTEIMKAPMDSSKAQAPSGGAKGGERAPGARSDAGAGGRIAGGRDPAPAERHRRGRRAGRARAAGQGTGREDAADYRGLSAIQIRARGRGFPGRRAATPKSRYLTVVYRLIKSHLHESPELHLESANKQGVVDFYVDKGGTLVGRKLVSSSGSPNLDSAVMTAIAAAAPYPAPPNWRARSLHYNFGRALSAGLPVSPSR